MTNDNYLKEIYARMSEFDKFMGEMRAESAARREALAEFKAELQESLDEIKAKQEKTDRSVDGLEKKILRWEGKLGGFLFVVTCLGSFFAMFKDQILGLIKG